MLTYREYYQNCSKSDFVYDFSYKVLSGNFFGQNYTDSVRKANADLNKKLEHDTNIYTPPGTAKKHQPLLRLKDPWNLDSIENIAQYVIPYLEKNIFKCSAYVHGCYVYKTKIGTYSLDTVGSLKWHIDNHPKEVIKAMVYLDDVCTESAPFEMLIDQQKRGIKYQTTRVDYKKWKKNQTRFTEKFIQDYETQGSSRLKITGSTGTVCYFDNNVLHKANFAESRERNVIVFMAKPSSKKFEKYISKEYTGTNYHIDVFKDPEFIGVNKK